MPVQYLDANGNPQATPPVYLDPNTGEPLSGHPDDNPGYSLSSILHGTDPAHQAFDKAAETEPVDTSSVGGFAKSVANNLGAGAVRLFSPIAHPINTLASIGQMSAAATGNTGATV